jgi:dTDP-4-dehydrorhamnose reductase
MSKFLILGISGQLGHLLGIEFSSQGNDVYGISRKDENEIVEGFNKRYGFNSLALEKVRNITNLKRDLTNFGKISSLIKDLKPDYIINASGLIKQKVGEVQDFLSINSILPRNLALLSEKLEFQHKIIHFSTDCVFDGISGEYNDYDIPNAQDWYGLSKSLGELTNRTTLRTSIIGPEIFSNLGLFEWVLSQKHVVNGYQYAYWNGFTTLKIFEIIYKNLDNLPDKTVNLATKTKISKFELIKIIKDKFKLEFELKEDFNNKIDRSLIHSPELNSIIQNNSDYKEMISDLAKWLNLHSTNKLY